MSYLGRSAKLSLKAQEKVSFLATAGQTVKTGLSYTPSFIEVYVNGVLLTDTTDFTATNGNSITFTVALLLNDEVTVISLKTFTVADHYNKTEADTLLAAKATNTALATTNTAVALKAPIASPSFTGPVIFGGNASFPTASNYSSANTIRQQANALIFSGGSDGYYFNRHDNSVSDMHIDAAGRVTKPLQPAFDVHHNGSSYNSGTTSAGLNLNAARYNIGNHYNLSTRRFVAPVSGLYQFNFRTIVSGATNNAHIRMYKNGSQLQGGDSHYSSSNGSWGNWAYSLSTLLSANDYIEIYTGATEVIHGNNYQSFSGYLLG